MCIGELFLLCAALNGSSAKTDIRKVAAGMSETSKKKRYGKPELSRVDLKPEEAVLGACKTSGTAGPGGPNCNILLGGCSSSGS